MKILYLTKYTRKGASSRMRSYQYFPYFEEKGINVSVLPLFSEKYLDCLYAKKSVIKIKYIVIAYIKRFFKIWFINKYDLIVIEKELFPYCPSWFEYIISSNKKCIIDYDDAIFHNYDLHPNIIVRFLLKNKIDKIMRYSHTVTVGNHYLANRASRAQAKKIYVIPTVIDINRYTVKKYLNNTPIVIGWIGTQSSFKYLFSIKNVLKRLTQEYNILIHIVGTKKTLGLGDKEVHFEWSEDTEVNSILKFDIGIMPLFDTPWEQGKCAYKLIQYMGCGIPVVASAIGANNSIVHNEQNGYLVHTKEEWYNAISLYINNIENRKQHGRHGRHLVEEEYCIQRQVDKYIQIYKELFNE
jgi:glycosyltransferase involved in cell wall biosynthesis